MQTSFETGQPTTTDQSDFGLVEPPLFTYQLDIDKPEPIAHVRRDPVKPAKTPKPVKSNVFIVKNDTSKEVETAILPTDTPIISSPGVDYPKPPIPEPTGPTSIINVEFVPVYPGCEGLATNAEKIECLSSKINTFINRNFRKEILENLERNQTQKIYVQFKIDSQGFIKGVRANSNNEKLKKEAQRVVANLPKMKPGRQGDKNVEVLYTVPIVFQIK